MFFNFKFSKMKIRINDYLKPVENSVIHISVDVVIGVLFVHVV